MFQKEIYSTAFSNTTMFVFGVVFGVVVNIVFDTVHEYVDPTKDLKRYLFLFGMLQIFVNAVIVKIVSDQTNQQLGLFSLGLLSSQKLIIKRIYEFI